MNRRQRNDHEGDDTTEHGGYDRRDGTGRAQRRGGQAGAGKFNAGQNPDQQYKKKDADAVETAEGATTEEQRQRPEREKRRRKNTRKSFSEFPSMIS